MPVKFTSSKIALTIAQTISKYINTTHEIFRWLYIYIDLLFFLALCNLNRFPLTITNHLRRGAFWTVYYTSFTFLRLPLIALLRYDFRIFDVVGGGGGLGVSGDCRVTCASHVIKRQGAGHLLAHGPLRVTAAAASDTKPRIKRTKGHFARGVAVLLKCSPRRRGSPL